MHKDKFQKMTLYDIFIAIGLRYNFVVEFIQNLPDMDLSKNEKKMFIMILTTIKPIFFHEKPKSLANATE